MRFDEAASGGSACVLHPVAPALLHEGDETDTALYFHATGAVCNLPMLAQAAGASGFMNAAPDTDGILRRVPLLMELDGRVYPSLALAATMAATGSRDLMLRISNVKTASLTVGNYVVPVDGARHQGSGGHAARHVVCRRRGPGHRCRQSAAAGFHQPIPVRDGT